MKPGEVQTYLPPPPHKIVDYLNGSIIGHNVMKKAISVAIYNHFCNINFSRYEQLLMQKSLLKHFLLVKSVPLKRIVAMYLYLSLCLCYISFVKFLFHIANSSCKML